MGMTLRKFSDGISDVPAGASWYLADIAEAKGRQDMFIKQSPQRLKVLRDHAIIESALASNRIEGVEIDKTRIPAVLKGRGTLRDRDEEEVRGYQDALRWIHDKAEALPVSEATIRKMHRLCRGDIWDAGKYKDKDIDIIEKFADGSQQVRFRSTSARKTPPAMRDLIDAWNSNFKNRPVHPVILAAALNLDFLCIHPFRDGNGRISRLLLLQCCYHLGIEVGRYISFERLIEENKSRYYETLKLSSDGWHQGKHDPWHYINYILFILKSAYREFEERMDQMRSPRGEKAKIVSTAIIKQKGEFRLVDIEQECPGVGRDWIRALLWKMCKKGAVTCKGKGPAARWRYYPGKG